MTCEESEWDSSCRRLVMDTTQTDRFEGKGGQDEKRDFQTYRDDGRSIWERWDREGREWD